MDTNENGAQPVKRSPFADSPYVSVHTAPQTEAPAPAPQTEAPAPAAQTAPPRSHPQQRPAPTPAPKQKKSKRGLFAVLTVVLVAICCSITALGISGIWNGRMNRMEAAMEDKFAALEALYREAQQGNAAQAPTTAPMTPGQVYAQNVEAIVTITAGVVVDGSYGEGYGSGFFISDDGYIVTNYHVIRDATYVNVTTYQKETLKADVVGYVASNDVALLKVDIKDQKFVKLGSSDKLAVGDQVVAIGSPLTLEYSLSSGYVSAKDRQVELEGAMINMLQTDTSINPGNSGGPLFNMNGEVIGITVAKYSGVDESGVTYEGLAFAIPMDDVAGMLEDIREFGYVKGVYLGVYVSDVNTAGQYYGLPAGAYVEHTESGHCADKAGVCKGDIIVSVGGYDVKSVNDLTRVLRRFEPGETTSITVYRNGRQVYLQVTLEEKPTAEEETAESNKIEDWLNSVFPFG